MAQLIVRGLEDEVKERLQIRASRHGQSMEAEARDILRDALKRDDDQPDRLGSRIAARFQKIGLKPHETIDELRGADVQSPFEE